MFVGGAWARRFSSLNPEIEIGVAPLPTFNEEARATALYSYGWMINKNSDNQDVAWKLAQFLAASNPDFWWDTCGYIQPVQGQLAKLQEQDPVYLGAFIEDFSYGNYLFRSGHFQEFVSILSRAQSTVMSENVNVATVMKAAQTEALQVIR